VQLFPEASSNVKDLKHYLYAEVNTSLCAWSASIRTTYYVAGCDVGVREDTSSPLVIRGIDTFRALMMTIISHRSSSRVQ